MHEFLGVVCCLEEATKASGGGGGVFTAHDESLGGLSRQHWQH